MVQQQAVRSAAGVAGDHVTGARVVPADRYALGLALNSHASRIVSDRSRASRVCTDVIPGDGNAKIRCIRIVCGRGDRPDEVDFRVRRDGAENLPAVDGSDRGDSAGTDGDGNFRPCRPASLKCCPFERVGSGGQSNVSEYAGEGVTAVVGDNGSTIDLQPAAVVGAESKSKRASGVDLDRPSRNDGVEIASAAGDRIVESPVAGGSPGIRQVGLGKCTCCCCARYCVRHELVGDRQVHRDAFDLDPRSRVTTDDVPFKVVGDSVAVGADADICCSVGDINAERGVREGSGPIGLEADVVPCDDGIVCSRPTGGKGAIEFRRLDKDAVTRIA